MDRPRDFSEEVNIQRTSVSDRITHSCTLLQKTLRTGGTKINKLYHILLILGSFGVVVYFGYCTNENTFVEYFISRYPVACAGDET